MSFELSPWLSIPHLPTAWKLWVLRQMSNKAGGILGESFEQVLKQVEATWRMERSWYLVHSEGKEHARPLLPEIDPKVDFVIGSIESSLKRMVHLFAPDTDKYQKAHTIYKKYFSRGAGAIIHLPAVEELAVVEEFVRDFNGPFSEDMALLGLTLWVDELTSLLPQYQEAIEEIRTHAVRFSDVRASRRADKDALASLITKLLYHADQNPDDTALMSDIFGIYTQLSKEYKALRKKHGKKSTPEINPDNGELIPKED